MWRSRKDLNLQLDFSEHSLSERADYQLSHYSVSQSPRTGPRILSTKKGRKISPNLDWNWWTDLNPRPTDYKSVALPTELHQRIWYILCVSSEKYQAYLKIYFVLCSQTQDDTQEDGRILEDEECARRIQKTPAASNQTDERSRWKEGSSRKPRWQLEAGRERQECESRVNRASSRTGCRETEEAIPGPAPTSPPSESLRSPCRIDNHYYSSEVTFLQFQAIKKPIRV